jgi:hypothetical protein
LGLEELQTLKIFNKIKISGIGRKLLGLVNAEGTMGDVL